MTPRTASILRCRRALAAALRARSSSAMSFFCAAAASFSAGKIAVVFGSTAARCCCTRGGSTNDVCADCFGRPAGETLSGITVAAAVRTCPKRESISFRRAFEASVWMLSSRACVRCVSDALILPSERVRLVCVVPVVFARLRKMPSDCSTISLAFFCTARLSNALPGLTTRRSPLAFVSIVSRVLRTRLSFASPLFVSMLNLNS